MREGEKERKSRDGEITRVKEEREKGGSKGTMQGRQKGMEAGRQGLKVLEGEGRNG